MKTYLTPLFAAALLVLFGVTTAPAQDLDLPDDLFEALDEQDESDRRLAQRPNPPREPQDVVKPREPGDRDPGERGRDRGDRKDPPRDRRPDGARPGPEQLQARLAAVERKLDRILLELRRLEARDRGPRPQRPDRDVFRPRDGGPPRDHLVPAPPERRPQMDRLRDRPDGPPPRDRIRPRPEGPRPDIERFPGRSPDGPPRDRGPRFDRGFGPPDRDRLEGPDRRPLPSPARPPRPPRDRDWDRPDRD